MAAFFMDHHTRHADRLRHGFAFARNNVCSVEEFLKRPPGANRNRDEGP
jgi:hypothetical protein